LIGQAILSGNTSRTQIESYIRSYDWPTIRHGYVGDYYFNASGDAIGLWYSLQQIKNGELIILE
jgi:hypothetical protein